MTEELGWLAGVALLSTTFFCSCRLCRLKEETTFVTYGFYWIIYSRISIVVGEYRLNNKDFANDAVFKENEFPEGINAGPQSLPCSLPSNGDDAKILDDDSSEGSAREPKLFNGLSFDFTGEFLAPYKRDLQSLIIAAGGTIIKEMLTGNSHNAEATRLRTLAVYNLDPPQGSELGDEVSIVLKRLDEAVKVALEFGCQGVPHTWVLGSVEAAKLQPFSSC